jgi:hypothetical protein
MKSKEVCTIIFSWLFVFVFALQIGSLTTKGPDKLLNNGHPIKQQHETRLDKRQHETLHEKRMRLLKARGHAQIKKPEAEISASLNVDLLGVWPYGSCYASDIDKSRNIAVIGSGKAILVLDISDPASITILGEVFLGEQISEIEISGNYAYVGTYVGETMFYLRVIDISTPSSPTTIGSTAISDYCSSLALTTNYAYTGGGYWGGNDIIDISVPSNPTYIDTFATTNQVTDRIKAWSDYLFTLITDYSGPGYGEEEIKIYSISSPESPSLLGAILDDTDDVFNCFDVSDLGYIYLSFYDNSAGVQKLSVYDFLSNPSDPSEIGYYSESGVSLTELIVEGSYLYFVGATWAGGGFGIMSISTPSAPSPVGSCSSSSWGWDLDYSNGYIIDGTVLYDVSVPSSPDEVGSYTTPSSLIWADSGMVLTNDYAYVAYYGDGLRILDVSDPGNITDVGLCDTVNAYAGITKSGNYVYGADYTGGFWVVDVSTPALPTEVASMPLTWNAYGVLARGNYAYVAGYQSISSDDYATLYVYDISDPSNPEEEGYYVCSEVSRNYGSLDIEGDSLYLATTEGFRIIDISDPSAPSEIGSYNSGGWTDGLVVRGDYAYLSGDWFSVVDVTIPSSPSEEGWLAYEADGIAISGNYVYLAIAEDHYAIPMGLGLRVIDISDPSAPTQDGYYEINPTHWGSPLAAIGNKAMIRGCLYLFQNPLAPEVTLTSPSDGATVSGSVSIGADASHTSGITQIEFYVDGVLENTDTSSPYSYVWDSTTADNGFHSFMARAYNTDGNSSDAQIVVDVMNITDPVADIKANGSDTPITIDRPDVLTIDISLDTGTYTGTNADWWLIAKTPFGWFHYDLSQDWLPGKVVSRQGSLINIPNYEVLNRAGLPKGTYFFIFGVDLNMNGVIDMAEAYYDQVKVTIN